MWEEIFKTTSLTTVHKKQEDLRIAKALMISPDAKRERARQKREKAQREKLKEERNQKEQRARDRAE